MSTGALHLGVIIVTHNNESEIGECLDTLQVNGTGSFVVVRDCNSADRTVHIAQRHSAVSKVIVGPNVGFGAACNEGVLALDESYDVFLLLNPDTRVTCLLDDLLIYAQRFGDFGCIGIQQRSLTNQLVWSWDQFPSPSLEWKKARKSRLLQRSPSGYVRDRRVDWAMGAFLLIHRNAFTAVEGFDERYFMFTEEIDLCRKLGEIGRPTYYVNDFHFQHSDEDKSTLWRAVLRLNSRRAYDRKWLRRSDIVLCQLAQTYRWVSDFVQPVSPAARRLALPRLLATWNLIHAKLPPESVPNIDSWRAVRPFWKDATRPKDRRTRRRRQSPRHRASRHLP
jgi:N-acetylglucosaminyl-diphospho-decaprenol L-rhamnosyltransferase